MTEEQTQAPAPPEPFDDPFAALGHGLKELTVAVQSLGAQCGREHDRAAVRERVIDRLHEDNQRLGAGERHLMLRPLLTDIQRTRHELLRESVRLPEQLSGHQVAQMLRSFAYTLELTLLRGGIEVIAPETGTALDSARQRVTGVVDTTEQALDATVAVVTMDGYFDTVAGRVTTPAEVQVHRWAAPETPSDTPAKENDDDQ